MDRYVCKHDDSLQSIHDDNVESEVLVYLYNQITIKTVEVNDVCVNDTQRFVFNMIIFKNHVVIMLSACEG